MSLLETTSTTSGFLTFKIYELKFCLKINDLKIFEKVF